MNRLLLVAAAGFALAGCSKHPEPAPLAPATAESFPAPSIDGLPAGEYKLDPMHASLTFKVNHLGFSHYTAKFTRFDAAMKFDPAHPETVQLAASIDPQSLELNAPPAGFHDELMGKTFFDAATYPTMAFATTKVEKTGAFTARATGNLTLHGVTKPVTLDIAFNGGYPGLAGLDPNARIGFTANGTLKRSDFGISMGIPAPGSRLGVGDEVAFTIDAEFIGPALKGSATTSSQ